MLIELDINELGFLISWGNIVNTVDPLGTENKKLLGKLEEIEKMQLSKHLEKM